MDYALAYGLDGIQAHLLVRYVRAMDSVFFDHQERTQKAKQKAKPQRKGLFGRRR